MAAQIDTPQAAKWWRRYYGRIPRLPPAVLWCLVGLLLVESFVRVAFVRVSNFGQLAHLREKMANVQALEIKPQVIFFGNSVAREGVDPWAYEKASGQTAYNMGASDGTFYLMRQMYLLHQDQQFANIQKAFFFINPPDLKIRRMPEIKDSRFMSLYEKILATRNLSEWLLSEISCTYAYRDEIFYQIKLFLSGKSRHQMGFQANEDARGFAPRHVADRLKAEWVRLETLRIMSDYHLPGYQFEALLNLTTEMKDKGIEVFWVNPPLPEKVRKVLSREFGPQLNEFKLLMGQAASRLGVRLLDTSAAFADGCFYDFLHLKPECASQYAAMLAEMVRSKDQGAPVPEARQR